MNKGYNLLEFVISTMIVSLIAILIGKFALISFTVISEVDKSYFIQDHIEYSSDFMRDYIETMKKIDYIEGNETNDGWIVRKIYFSSDNESFNIGIKNRFDGESIKKAMVFNRIDNPNKDMSPSLGAEYMSYYVNTILAKPLPIGCNLDDAYGIKFVFGWETIWGMKNLNKSFYFKNKDDINF